MIAREWFRRVVPRERRAAMRDAVRPLRWRMAVSRILVSGVRLRLVAGEVDEQSVPLVMCLWNRPNRLPQTLAQLAAQRDCPPIRLILWNNRWAHNDYFLALLQHWGAQGAVASVEYHASRFNIGGIARFLVARQITSVRQSRPFLMLDDDEDVSDLLVHDLLASYAPRTYAGYWAFVITGEYWARREATPGEDASYVGTGGSVCDSELVHVRGFFRRLPARYGFLEDIWASVVARSRGWRLRKVDTPIEFTSEADNQYHGMIDAKRIFYDELRARMERGALVG